MSAIRVEATMSSDGKLSLNGLPFRAGEVVQVVIMPKTSSVGDNPYPLRGLPVEYIDPFEPAVPPEDWDALNDPA
jgi:hypothetical protein